MPSRSRTKRAALAAAAGQRRQQVGRSAAPAGRRPSPPRRRREPPASSAAAAASAGFRPPPARQGSRSQPAAPPGSRRAAPPGSQRAAPPVVAAASDDRPATTDSPPTSGWVQRQHRVQGVPAGWRGPVRHDRPASRVAARSRVLAGAPCLIGTRTRHAHSTDAATRRTAVADSHPPARPALAGSAGASWKATELVRHASRSDRTCGSPSSWSIRWSRCCSSAAGPAWTGSRPPGPAHHRGQPHLLRRPADLRPLHLGRRPGAALPGQGQPVPAAVRLGRIVAGAGQIPVHRGTADAAPGAAERRRGAAARRDGADLPGGHRDPGPGLLADAGQDRGGPAGAAGARRCR